MNAARRWIPVAFAALCALPGATFAAEPAELPLRAIAIAEDRRAWNDGVLKGYLADPSAGLRARAALAVGRLQDSTAVPALLPLLGDPFAEVRREAVFALGQAGWKGARPAVEGALADKDPEVVDLAIEALGKLGDKAATPKVVSFLDSRRAAQRSHAAVALWRLADTASVGPLLRHLSGRDAALRWRVVWALEKLPLPERIAPKVVPLLRDKDALVRAHAARTLGRLKARSSVAPLVAACGDKDDAVIVNALRSLAQIADSSNGAQLAAVHPLLKHANPHVRVTAATVLADSFVWGGADSSVAFNARASVRRGLGDLDPATRGACGRAVVIRLGARGIAGVQTLFSDSSVYVRVAVLDGVRQLRDPAILGPLLNQGLERSRPLLERMTAAEVLGQVGGQPWAGPLAAMVLILRQGVDDPNVLYAAACAGALGDWGDSSSVGSLAEAYAKRGHDADGDARVAILGALRQLAGRAFADSVEAAGRAKEPAVQYSSGFEEAPSARGAVIHTSAGDIEWAFESAVAPQTVRNFVTLARRGYFEGTVFHRVVPDFVIQDGDPTGTGSGGPGHTIRCEYNRLRYETGMVGMALSGKDTGGSQWFVTLSPQLHLDGRYTIFARVTRGLDVARRVTQGTRIASVEILE